MTTPLRRLSLTVGPWLLAASVDAATVTRGPYLQQGTPSSVVVRWRTDVSTDSRVRYGTSPGSLTSFANDPTPTTEHKVTVSGLSPLTKYYYSVGTAAAPLAGDSSYFFTTAPAAGTPSATRIWAIGDAGTGDANQKAVRDAYAAHTGSKYTNLWLMLGDNAYSSGTDSQYQSNVFNIYDNVSPSSLPARFLRQSVLWPTLGNHDTAGSSSPPPTLPYYQIFNLPTNGEAGGLASGTEDYYSLDYANIHFVCLDSMTSSRSSTGPMLTWLANDLAATTQDWIIAFWHHPPYTHGTHNSDYEAQLKEMRQNAVPILENYGVDLVLTGHSHNYERSFLIDGHYGSSSTWNPATMLKDGGNGRTDGTGAYKKPTAGLGPREGAVYVVNGNSGNTCSTGCGQLDYPAMFVSFGQEVGSMVIDVSGNRLDAVYLRSDGAKRDYFTIQKGVGNPSIAINDVSVTEGNSGTKNAVFTVSLSSSPTSAVTVQYATANGTAAAPGDYTAVSGTLSFGVGVTTKTISVVVKGDTAVEGNETYYLALSNATNATIGDSQGQGTIVDDDAVGTFALTVTRSGNGSGTVTSAPAGINCGATCSASFNSGASVTLTAAANPSSNFTGWSGACTGTGTCQVTMNAAKSVTATFTLKTFALSVSKTGNGTGTVASSPSGISCGATCSASFNSGTSVTLTATPDAGSGFTAWSGACSGAGSCLVTMDAAKSVTAAFALQGGAPTIFEKRVAANTDDAEEKAGAVNNFSGKLDLGVDAGASQTVGLRITGVSIPKGATIVNAWVRFKVAIVDSSACTLAIRGQASDNAATFGSGANGISSRPVTAASTSWTPQAWTAVDQSGPAQQSTSLAAVVQEIVNRPGWVAGNSIVLIVTGTGSRAAQAHNGDPAGAALLHVEYQ
jgi:hypothetical protein